MNSIINLIAYQLCITSTEQKKTKTASALKAVFIIYQLKNTVIFQPAEPQ
jgi:hypothetical protein